MSEVIERPSVARPPSLKPVEERKDIPPPPAYKVIAICEETFCVGKFVLTIVEVFQKNASVAFKIADGLKKMGVVTIQGGTTREIAESLVDKAEDSLQRYAADCECETARRIKFKAESV